MNNMLPLIIFAVTCSIMLAGGYLLDKNERLAIGLMVFSFFAMLVDCVICMKLSVAHFPALEQALKQVIPSFFITLILIFAGWVLVDTTDDVFHNPGGGSSTLLKGIGFILGIGVFGTIVTYIIYL